METSRWIQRFENFNAAFSKLEEAVQKTDLFPHLKSLRDTLGNHLE